MFKNRSWFYLLLFFPVVLIASLAYDFGNNDPFLSSLNEVSTYLVSLIYPNTTVNLQPWWIYAFLGLIMLIAVGLYFINRKTVPDELAAYTEDRFKNWYWRWEWTWNSVLKQWEVIKLIPYCPDCDVQLLEKSSSIVSRAGCPQCYRDFEGQLGEYDDAKGIEYLIHKKLREESINS